MNETKTIELPDGGHLNARLDGVEGAPWLVMSNSVMTDLTIWDGQAAALADRFRVLRYDQRGHGRSSVFEGPMDFGAYGVDLLVLLDAFGVERCTFVGLSMGVPTGLAAYAATPDRFEGFVAVDGVSRSAPGREAYWAERREFARANGMAAIAEQTAMRWLPNEYDGNALARRLAEIVAATPVEGFAAASHALQSYDHSSVVGKISCPFLSIAGSADGEMPQNMRSQFAGVPDAQFAVIDGAGHLPNFQKPDAFNTALSAFLDQSV